MKDDTCAEALRRHELLTLRAPESDEDAQALRAHRAELKRRFGATK